MTSCLQQQEVTKKCRPEQALSQKNDAHITVAPHVLPARVDLKQHPCCFTPIWTPFFCGLERGEENTELSRIGVFKPPSLCAGNESISVALQAWMPVELHRAGCELKRARLNWFISRKPKATHTGCPFLGYFFLAKKEVSRALTSKQLRSYERVGVRYLDKISR